MTDLIKRKDLLKTLERNGATIRISRKNNIVIYRHDKVVTISKRKEYPPSMINHTYKTLMIRN
jgi:hypothetical protein